jgi:ribonuclease-3
MPRPYEKLFLHIEKIEEKIGYIFKNKNTLALAFIHRSFFHENQNSLEGHNERLEFLGDSVLGLLIAEHLYTILPLDAEGHLSYLRAHLVEATTCAQFVQKLGLAEFILLGRGEEIQEGRKKISIQADFFEALLAAIYLDGGLESAKQFFWSCFADDIAMLVKKPSSNWKAELQEVIQRKHQVLPLYKVLQEIGPDHSKTFSVGVFLEDKLLGTGMGSSKKEAEQNAAKSALEALEG